jgi:hypothetical protein
MDKILLWNYRTYLAELIFDKLLIHKEELKKEFNQTGRINSCVIDDLCKKL